jgi:hypothetical protein
MVNIEYTVSDDFLTVEPKHRQVAGVMGQAKACTVTFQLPTEQSNWAKRIEFLDTTGKMFTTDEDGYDDLLVVSEDGREVSITLPWQWTVYGGTAYIRLVVNSVDLDGNVVSVLATPDRALLFENSKVAADIVVRRSLAQLVVYGHATVKQTDELYEKVKESYESGEFVGATGATPNITIGFVKTLSAGSDVKVEITGTKENPILNFAIPQGEKGYAPVLGVDYFTETDKQEIYDELLPEAAQAAVHIGDTAPTDPNTKMWINPNGEALVALLCSQAQALTDEQKAQAKANLGLEEGGNDIVVDEALSLESTNPVQNKVITEAINSTMRKGTDPVPSLADDTPDFWRNLGTGAWEITGAGQANINGGAFFLATILNMPSSYFVYQVAFAPITNNAYFRTAGANNTWVKTWTPLFYSKQELVQSVLDALPTWEGGAY